MDARTIDRPYVPIDEATRRTLTRLLRGNAYEGRPLHMGRDTRIVYDNPVIDEEVIDSIMSIPCHY